MSTVFFYVDESHDDAKFCLTALGIRHRHWRECFDLVRAHRKDLRSHYGVKMVKEIHSRELLKGVGKISSRIVIKWERSQIFRGCLALIPKLPGVFVVNVCLEKTGRADAQMMAWDRLINRIERTMKAQEDNELTRRRELVGKLDGKIGAAGVEAISTRLLAFRSRAVIVADEGREYEITSAIRRMHVFNPIPSRFGVWHDGSLTMNITTDHVIEDPVFKPSNRSYFIQLADCVAYALLKREVPPTPRIKKYGIEKMFDETVSKVCFLAASPKDPLGIVRK